MTTQKLPVALLHDYYTLRLYFGFMCIALHCTVLVMISLFTESQSNGPLYQYDIPIIHWKVRPCQWHGSKYLLKRNRPKSLILQRRRKAPKSGAAEHRRCERGEAWGWFTPSEAVGPGVVSPENFEKGDFSNSQGQNRMEGIISHKNSHFGVISQHIEIKTVRVIWTEIYHFVTHRHDCNLNKSLSQSI